jgi:hypothetical protein
MSAIEKKLISEEDVRLLGNYFATVNGIKQREILYKTFGSRLSYTRGEPDHTSFLEGQKSVLQFIDNAVLAVTTEEK